jgi:D-alanyl-D-alanine carboxypeptidase
MLADLEEAVADTMNDHPVPGAIVGVFLTGQGGTWVHAQGLADVSRQLNMHYLDKGRIGGITKAYTATVILQLVDEGALSLDDTVSDFNLAVSLPNADQITVRQLLNMTSGLFDYTEDDTFQSRFNADPTRVWSPVKLLELAAAHEPEFAPGAGWSEANTNYIVLGLIAEQVTGNTLRQEIMDRIATPLDTTSARLPTGYKISSRFANGYTYANGLFTDVTYLNPSAFWAGGGMIANLPDLQGAATAFAAGTLISAAAQAERIIWVDTGQTDGLQYGLGLMKYDDFIGHSGTINGFASAMYNWPEQSATIVVILNNYVQLSSGADVATDLFQKLAQIVFPEESFSWQHTR